jgi:hypothetical protein
MKAALAASLLESTTQYCIWPRTQPANWAVRNLAVAVSVTARRLAPVQKGGQGLTSVGQGYGPGGGTLGGGCMQGWVPLGGPFTYSSDKSAKMKMDSELS